MDIVSHVINIGGRYLHYIMFETPSDTCGNIEQAVIFCSEL